MKKKIRSSKIQLKFDIKFLVTVIAMTWLTVTVSVATAFPSFAPSALKDCWWARPVESPEDSKIGTEKLQNFTDAAKAESTLQGPVENALLSLALPRMEIWTSSANRMIGTSKLSAGSIRLNYSDWCGNQEFQLRCVALYPVEIFHKYYHKAPQSSHDVYFKAYKDHVSYSDFFNVSTYEFTTTATLEFLRPEKALGLVGCQRIVDPCTSRLLRYEWLNPSFYSNYTARKSQEIDLTFFPQLPKQTDIDDEKTLNLSPSWTARDSALARSLFLRLIEPPPPVEGANCTARFFYERVPADAKGGQPPAYKFRCERSDGKKNRLILETCVTKCAAIFQQRPRIPSHCWSEDVGCKENQTACPGQEGMPFRSFTPFVAQCGFNAIKETDENTPGSLAFFGLPPAYTLGRPPIYFSEDGPVAESMISMTPFNSVQLLGSRVRVTCTSSAFYCSTTFQFALKIHGSDHLVLLPGSNRTRFSNTMIAHSQTVSIFLNRTDIEKIICFAGRTRSPEWLNTTLPIEVLEFDSFYKRISPPKLPCLNSTTNSSNAHSGAVISVNFRMKPAFRQSHTFSPTHPEFLVPTLDSFPHGGYIDISCRASFPVQFRVHRTYSLSFHEFDPYNDTDHESSLGHDPWYSHRSFSTSDLWDETKQTFWVSGYFQFHQDGNAVDFFTCEPVHVEDAPCGAHHHVTIMQSFNVDSKRHNFTWYSPSLVEARAPDIHFVKKLEIIKEAESNEIIQDSECEAIFYYYEREGEDGFPGWAFRCQLPFDGVGKVNLYECETALGCLSAYDQGGQGLRHIQSPKCWKHRQPGEKECSRCEETIPGSGHSPILASCTGFGDTGFLYVPEVKEPYESSAFSFAVFGLAPHFHSRPEIYFRAEDVAPEKMLVMEDFDPFRFVDHTLEVNCRASAFFTTGQILYGFLIDGTTKVEFLGDAYQKTVALSQYHLANGTGSYGLDQEESGLVFCFSPLISQKGWLNVSRPFHSYAPKQLRISISPNGEEHDLVQLSSLVEPLPPPPLNLPAASTNLQLTCHVTGYPPPEIVWTTTSEVDLPRPFTGMINATHSFSKLIFPQIYPKMTGNYSCRAKNRFENQTQTVQLHVQEPAKGLTPAMVTLAVLVPVGCLLIIGGVTGVLVHRHIRGLKKEIRDLSPGELNDFFAGASKPDQSKPYTLPYDLKYEIPRDCIFVEEDEILGSGEFGVVKRGRVRLPNSQEETTVAVKMAKEDMCAGDFLALLTEIKILAHIGTHDQIASLVGASTVSIKQCQVWIAVEFCPEKDLKSFLESRRIFFTNLFPKETTVDVGYSSFVELVDDAQRLDTLDLLRFSRDLARGLEHLTLKNVVHGDLATRNLLVTEGRRIKISDFGLAHHLNKNYVVKKLDRMPWRWMSPQAIIEGRFSVESDVWSVGVVLWEIFSLGEEPHLRADVNLNFVAQLEAGHRMRRPIHANEDLYTLMTDCWSQKPADRPTAAEISEQLMQIEQSLKSDIGVE